MAAVRNQPPEAVFAEEVQGTPVEIPGAALSPPPHRLNANIPGLCWALGHVDEKWGLSLKELIVLFTLWGQLAAVCCVATTSGSRG